MEHLKHKLHAKGKHVEFDHQDIRNMGGLKEWMPSTYKTFMIATVAIAGIPPLAGFFSKDEILMHAINMGAGEFAGGMYLALWGIGMITAFLTAFYMFRLTLTTFHGSFKLPKLFSEAEGSEQYLHESPRTMTIPLWSLAGLVNCWRFYWPSQFHCKNVYRRSRAHQLAARLAISHCIRYTIDTFSSR